MNDHQILHLNKFSVLIVFVCTAAANGSSCMILLQMILQVQVLMFALSVPIDRQNSVDPDQMHPNVLHCILALLVQQTQLIIDVSWRQILF